MSGALTTRPALPLGNKARLASKKTIESDTYELEVVALSVALIPSYVSQFLSPSDNEKARQPIEIDGAWFHVSSDIVEDRGDFSPPDTYPIKWAMQDLNLRPPACRAGALAN